MKIFKIARNFITAVTLVIFAPNNIQAQEGGGFLAGTLRDLLIITGAGVGGAVLGLSTLSFVDEPSKNMKNIVNGGSIGIMIGVGIVIFGHAGKSKLLYDSASILQDAHKTNDFFEENKLFAETSRKNSNHNLPYYLAYKFSF
jgi:hypothetical protein